MEIKLNIYGDKFKKNKDGKKEREIEKTFAADTLFVRWKTVEDVLNILDVDTEISEIALGILIMKNISKLKDLLKDIFVDITDEDIRNMNVMDFIPLFKNIYAYCLELISGAPSEKNV